MSESGIRRCPMGQRRCSVAPRLNSLSQYPISEGSTRHVTGKSDNLTIFARALGGGWWRARSARPPRTAPPRGAVKRFFCASRARSGAHFWRPQRVGGRRHHGRHWVRLGRHDAAAITAAKACAGCSCRLFGGCCGAKHCRLSVAWAGFARRLFLFPLFRHPPPRSMPSPLSSAASRWPWTRHSRISSRASSPVVPDHGCLVRHP